MTSHFDRNERLDRERFNLILEKQNCDKVQLNSAPLTHREACTMRSKLLDVTRQHTKLVSIGFV